MGSLGLSLGWSRSYNQTRKSYYTDNSRHHHEYHDHSQTNSNNTINSHNITAQNLNSNNFQGTFNNCLIFINNSSDSFYQKLYNFQESLKFVVFPEIARLRHMDTELSNLIENGSKYLMSNPKISPQNMHMHFQVPFYYKACEILNCTLQRPQYQLVNSCNFVPQPQRHSDLCAIFREGTRVNYSNIKQHYIIEENKQTLQQLYELCPLAKQKIGFLANQAFYTMIGQIETDIANKIDLSQVQQAQKIFDEHVYRKTLLQVYKILLDYIKEHQKSSIRQQRMIWISE